MWICHNLKVLPYPQSLKKQFVMIKHLKHFVSQWPNLLLRRSNFSIKILVMVMPTCALFLLRLILTTIRQFVAGFKDSRFFAPWLFSFSPFTLDQNFFKKSEKEWKSFSKNWNQCLRQLGLYQTASLCSVLSMPSS